MSLFAGIDEGQARNAGFRFVLHSMTMCGPVAETPLPDSPNFFGVGVK
jgi:hypothetical protein